VQARISAFSRAKARDMDSSSIVNFLALGVFVYERVSKDNEVEITN
jgi:hypothetical protein